MKKRSYVLSEENWKTIKDTEYDFAILPWGATEPHNYHLPFGTDNIQSTYITEEAARKAWTKGVKPLVLPTIPFGVNVGQINLKFAINMNPSTQSAVLHDIVESLQIQGVKKFVLVNGHGGNDFKSIFRELMLTFPDMFLVVVNWYGLQDTYRFFEKGGDHANEMETSNLLHLAPHLVLPLSEAGEGKEHKIKLKGVQEGWVWTSRVWEKVTKDTGVGDPSKATSQKGEKFLQEVTDKMSDFFVELANKDLNDLYEPQDSL